MGDRANINAAYGGRQSGADGEAIMASFGGASPGGSTPPVNPSTAITGMVLGEPLQHKAAQPSNGVFSDVWQTAENAAGNIFAFHDDIISNNGWGGVVGSGNRNISISALSSADPATMVGSYVNTMDTFGTVSQSGTDGRNWKFTGGGFFDGIGYAWVNRHQFIEPPVNQPVSSCQLIKSSNNFSTYTPAPPGIEPYTSPMFPGTTFPAPSFVYFGKDGATMPSQHRANEFVYATSTDGYYFQGNSVILARCLRSKLADLSAADWQYFQGGNGALDSAWGARNTASMIISDSNKVGVTAFWYATDLNRFFAIEWYFVDYASATTYAQLNRATRWLLWEAQYIWGPWTKVETGGEWVATPGKALYGPTPLAKSLSGNSLQVVATGDFTQTSTEYQPTTVALTLRTANAAPSSCYGVTATAASATQVNVAFQIPPTNGGSTITGYTASATPAGGGTTTTASGSTSPIAITGLAGSTTYNVSVVATNAIGNSVATRNVQISTPSASTLVIDDQFAYADGALAGRTSPQGQTWTYEGGSGGNTVISNSVRAVSGAASGATHASLVNVGASNMRSRIDMTSASSGGFNFGVVIGSITGGNNAQFVVDVSNRYLFLNGNPVFTSGGSISYNENHYFELERSGNILKIYQDGALLTSYSMSSAEATALGSPQTTGFNFFVVPGSAEPAPGTSLIKRFRCNA